MTFWLCIALNAFAIVGLVLHVIDTRRALRSLGQPVAPKRTTLAGIMAELREVEPGEHPLGRKCPACGHAAGFHNDHYCAELGCACRAKRKELMQ